MTKTALITGAAKRVGKQMAETLHNAGINVMVHYRGSEAAAEELKTKLNKIRPNSCEIVQGDLSKNDSYSHIVTTTIKHFSRLDILINNASSFYPTPIEDVNEEQWDDLMASNLKAPIFLTKYAVPHLEMTQGCIINIVDIYADRPLAHHPIYLSAKAGLKMLTKSLARDLAPAIRVNGIAPGAVLWPENDSCVESQTAILKKVPLGKLGDPSDIATTAKFLALDAPYITGQIIAVDGGRSIVI